MVAGLKSAAERVWAWYDENPDYRIVHDDLDDMGRVTSIATYQKGAWVLHMLRKKVGDEAFWTGIQAYYAEHMNETATTDDFRRAMEEASGQDLEPFFDQWLYQGGNPAVDGWWEYDEAAGSVTIELRQTQEGEVRFDLPLEIGIYTDAQGLPSSVETVVLDDQVQRIRVTVESAPADVRLDPGTWALFRSSFERRR